MFIQSDHTDNEVSLNEPDLWKALKNGNREALSVLYLRCYEPLFRYGMSISFSEGMVKDGIQHLFLRLWKQRKSLGEVKSVQSYLFVSLRRIILRNKKQSQSRDWRANEFEKRNSQKTASVEDRLIGQEQREEQRKQLREAIHLLSPRQHEALLLRLDCGFSNREIATIMEISNKRVRNLFYEAIKRLREEIQIPSE